MEDGKCRGAGIKKDTQVSLR